MPVRRSYGSYDDGCAAAHALDLVGDRWALIVVRELMLGAKRFADLRADIPGISATVLTQRLRELEESGVVVQSELPPPARVKVYDLTEWGRGLEEVLQALGRWGAQSPTMPHDAHITDATAILSMRTMGVHAKGRVTRPLHLQLGLRGRDGRLADYVVDVTRRGAVVERGRVDDAQAVVTAEPNAWVDVLYHEADLDAAIAAGWITIEGDRDVVEELVDAYPVLSAPAV